jgi:hypothetical protein
MFKSFSLSLLLVVLIPFSSLAQTQRSSAEGILESRHDQSLESVRAKYFYTNDQIDPRKLNQLLEFLEQQKHLLSESARLSLKTQLIQRHKYEDQEAQERSLKALDEKAESLAAVNFAIDYTKDLIAHWSTNTSNRNTELVERVLLFFAATYTIYPENIFSGAIERAKNLAENFFEFRENDPEAIPASNLQREAQFLSPAELKKLQDEGSDLSKFDPPSSAFWQNNQVESYDPTSEEFLSLKMFPPKGLHEPEFFYERMGTGTIKFKTYWLDHSDLNKKGNPKKKKVTLRAGWESYTAGVVNHLARVVGYPAIPSVFRAKVKLNLGETSFEEFLADFMAMHGAEMGGPMTHIERIKGENAIYIKNVTLEAYPEDEDYRRIGPFRMGDNGFRNRREYRAMVLYNALIGLQDQFEHQSRVDAYRDPLTKEWMPLFFISDTSSALGLPTWGIRGAVNEYLPQFTGRKGDLVRIFWISILNSRTWKDTTYDDVKWMARRMARVSSQQIDQILATSGFPTPVKALYANKIKARFNHLIKDFNLDREGFKFHQVLSNEELAQKFPEMINNLGLLKEGAQEIENNTLPILGHRYTPYQAAVVVALNTFQNKLMSMVSDRINDVIEPISFDLGNTKGWGDIIYSAKRNVSVNGELGPGQKRYLLKDQMTVSIPIGLMHDKLTTPLAIYASYSFEYTHSVSKMTETFSSRFFGAMNPFSISSIRRTLAEGERLLLTHNIGFSAGLVKVKSHDDLKIEAALLGLQWAQVKQVYYSKPGHDLLEVAISSNKSISTTNGIDIRLITKLAAMGQASQSSSNYKLFRIDLLNSNQAQRLELEEAFKAALVDNNFSELNAISKPKTIDEYQWTTRYNWAFVLWTSQRENQYSELVLDGQDHLLYSYTRFRDRAFSRIFGLSDDINTPQAVKSIGSNFADKFKESYSSEMFIEAQPNADWTEYSYLDAKININHFDGYVTRREFENDVKSYFGKLSGESNYIGFRMPEGINQYLQVYAKMHWQLGSRAVMQLMKAATQEQNWEHAKRIGNFVGNSFTTASSLMNEAREVLKPINAKLPLKQKKTLFKAKTKLMLSVLKSFIGLRAQNINQLRKHIKNEDLWVITSISPILDNSHPAFRSEKGEIFYAPEIGKFQGHSPIENFYRRQLPRPIIE